jgi:hypothetical protein
MFVTLIVLFLYKGILNFTPLFKSGNKFANKEFTSFRQIVHHEVEAVRVPVRWLDYPSNRKLE